MCSAPNKCAAVRRVARKLPSSLRMSPPSSHTRANTRAKRRWGTSRHLVGPVRRRGRRSRAPRAKHRAAASRKERRKAGREHRAAMLWMLRGGRRELRRNRAVVGLSVERVRQGLPGLQVAAHETLAPRGRAAGQRTGWARAQLRDDSTHDLLPPGIQQATARDSRHHQRPPNT